MCVLDQTSKALDAEEGGREKTVRSSEKEAGGGGLTLLEW